MKNELKYLHETLCKFTMGKEKFDMILSSQRHCLNKIESGLNFIDNTLKGQ